MLLPRLVNVSVENCLSGAKCKRAKFFTRMDQLRPELDNVLQSLSLNGYSIFSLINEILPRRKWEDKRIKLLREDLERDTADICARLLSHMTSGPERVTKFGRVQFKNHGQVVPMDILPDNVFLEIFSFCLSNSTDFSSQHTSDWRTLVHVCQSWRRIIFASPRRLNLHLYCSNKTPVLKNLVFWPVTLPLTLNYYFSGNLVFRDEDNVATALEHSTRVHRVTICGNAQVIKKVATIMRKSFPALTHLDLQVIQNDDDFSDAPVIPRSLLGGPAPCLQHLRLKSVSFPRLPIFLLSARNLISLQLEEITLHGYISPEAMTGSLAVLTRLATLWISFDTEVPTPDRPTNPPIQVILPALSEFHYRGCSEYLEDFLAQVDTPRLNCLRIEYGTDEIEVLQLSRFVERTENLKLDKFTHAKASFYSGDSRLEFDRLQGKCSEAHLSLELCDREYLDVQVSCMVQVLGQLAVFPDVDELTIHGFQVMGPEEMGITQWLPFFNRFPAVKALRLSGGVQTSIVRALEETTRETVTDHVFPALRLIWLVEEGDEGEDEYEDGNEEDWNVSVRSIGRFLSLRQLAGCPVTVVNTEDEFIEGRSR